MKKATKKVVRTRPVAAKASPVRSKTLYTLTDIARPVAGNRLFAHTAAALTTLGMLSDQRPVVRRAAVISIMGPRAVSYHLNQKNFEAVGDGIRLTKSGLSTIREREADKGMVQKFIALFKNGKADKDIGVSSSQIAGVSVAL